MFDDQPINNNSVNNNPVGPGVPNNLPISEPDDMFAGVEPSGEEVGAISAQPTAEPAPQSRNTALEAGILKPKVQPEDNLSTEEKFTVMPRLEERDQTIGGLSQVPGMQQAPQEVYKLKEPVLANMAVKLFVILIVLGILGGGGYWVYSKFIASDVILEPAVTDTTNNNLSDTGNVNQDNIVDQTQPTDQDLAGINIDLNASTTNEQTNTDVSTAVQEQGVFFGQPIDSDGDGLDNETETKLGTDPNNWDTDNDALSDGDEVLIWKTNPLNPDSDGDGFKDGEEVKNGYNPLGAGKLFNVPTTTP